MKLMFTLISSLSYQTIDKQVVRNMKFLLLYTFTLFCCHIVLANDEKYILITRIKRIINEPIWKDNIIKQEIIVKNEVVIVKKALEVIIENSDCIEQPIPFDALINATSALYTALKCKYSNLIVDLFRVYFEVVSLCRMFENTPKNYKLSNKIKACINIIFKSTVELKKYIVKFIYNLYNLMSLTPILKFTDQTLIKSLLSINLFLCNLQIYYADHQNGGDMNSTFHEIDMKIIIAQIINLIERFRCKNCLIDDYYGLNILTKNKIKDLILDINNEKSLDYYIGNMLKKFDIYYDDPTLYIFAEITTVFYVEMYDPKNMLLKHIFDYPFFKTLIVRWKNCHCELELIKVYEEVAKSSDLQAIFDFQVLLIEVIRNIFHIKFINENFISTKESLEALKMFINQIVPKNYPTSLYDSIKQLQILLLDHLQPEKSPAALTVSSKKLLRNLSIITTLKDDFKTNDIEDSVKKLPMKDFIHKIVSCREYKIFADIFKELSFESNILGDYDLNRIHYTGKTTEQYDNQKPCKDLSLLRKNLLLFQMLMRGFQQVHDDSSNDFDIEIVRKAKSYIFDNLMHLYRTYMDQDEIRRIVLPLLIRFKYTLKKIDDYKMLPQVSIFYTNVIEKFELTNCLVYVQEYNLDIYYEEVKQYQTRNLLMHESQIRISLYKSLWNDRKRIMNDLKLNTSEYHMKDEKRDVYSMIVNQFIPIVDTNYVHTGLSDPILFPWNGFMTYDETINSAISQGIFDYQDLVRHQCFVMRWIISNILEIFLNFIINLTSLIEILENMKSHFIKFKYLPFPKSVKLHLRDIFHDFDSIFQDPSRKDIDKYKSNITEQLKLIRPSFDNYTTHSLKEQINIKFIDFILLNHVHFFKIFLKSINRSRIILDLSFSTCIHV